ncbi:MAG: prolyl oligopeptidase family serine peptidase [Sphingosinicella sp.]|uniref:prolyl oligopeptidase family serine peptidase n=1 Tax=Sphingosinicella sp. TaxID=1917971 RepID=UPI004037F5A8
MAVRGMLLAGLLAVTGTMALGQDSAPTDDPFTWLEEIQSERALAWARAENERTLGELQADPRYQRFYDQALTILQARDRIPTVSFRPDGLYNFWQDADHVRGIVRRTTLASYRTENPQWETVLDVDALAREEGTSWVYQGMSCLPPEERRCLVFLSDGGRDANVAREFDLRERRFVDGGFALPDGKQSVVWEDADTLLVAREWGPGTMTQSGYPFVVRRLRRGQTLDQAVEVYRGAEGDVSVQPFVLRDSSGRAHATGGWRGLDFFNSEAVLFRPGGNVTLPIPRRAALQGIVDGRVLLTIDEAWEVNGQRFAPDSVLSYGLAEWTRDPLAARPSLVWAPGERQTLRGIATTNGRLIVTILDNVRGRAFAYDYAGGQWRSTELELPRNATIAVSAASDQTDQAMFTVTDYLTPQTLWLYDGASGALETLRTTAARFDASRHLVEQREAVSRDGTRIPYFLVRPRDMAMDGSTPTLLYGYGGFQVSQVPNYSGTMGRLWLEQGNAYVVANLRGGGEFGPEWHQSAQLANKQRSWDDYIAVAEDLIRRRITSPRRLGVVGGSQGGLLVGTAITQRPELFNAAIIQVPLFDMLRYHLIGAGASWIGEYGDPRIAEQRAWLESYSPYQRLTPGRTYPTPFILTSTADDRVHPAHGRKAAARLHAIGAPYYYYENIEGGHAAAANLRETARRLALEYTYASRRLVD